MILIGQLKKMITIPWKTNIWKHEIKKKRDKKIEPSQQMLKNKIEEK